MVFDLAQYLLLLEIMIYIEESFAAKETVILRVEGGLDRESLSDFRRVCARHLQAKRKVQIDLGGISHICKEGRDFLRSIKNEVQLMGLNKYLEMDIHETV